MTPKEQLEELKKLQTEILSVASILEEKKAAFKAGFTALTSIEMDKPVTIEVILDAYAKALEC